MKIIKLLALHFLILCQFPSNSQTINGQVNDTNPLKVKVIPPHPEAASLGKYVDMPVNLYAGLPKIDIPIYTIKSFDLEIPISISYHASGIKAEEMSSSIGLGWSLNAGGVVSRTVRGFEDEHQYRGYLRTFQSGDLNNTEFFLSNGNVDVSYLYNNVQFESGGSCQNNLSNGDYYQMHADYMNIYFAARGGFDFEPDLFFYNLPGGESAKFVFDKQGNITQIPLKANQIEHFQSPNLPYNDLGKWEITGTNGAKYIFEARDTTSTYNTCSRGVADLVHEGNFSHPAVPLDLPLVSSWKLTQIVSPSGNDVINYEYENDALSYTTAFSSTSYNLLNGTDFREFNAGELPGCRNIVTGTEKRLRRIITTSGYEVEFVPSQYNRPEGGKFIKEIIVRFKGTEIKRVVLTQPSSMLESVQDCYPGSACTPPTTFEYFTSDAVINKESLNVDHWGYYNGASNIYLVPEVIYNNRLYQGSNREPNLTFAKTNTLKAIIHPTKGKTEFDFELNDYSNIPTNYTDQYVVNRELISSSQFTITSNVNQIYSLIQNFSLAQNTEVVYEFVLPKLGSVPGGISTDCRGEISSTAFTKYLYDACSVDPLIEQLPAGNYQFTSYFKPSSFTWDGSNPLEGQPFWIKIYKVNRLTQLVQNNKLQGGGLRIREIKKLDENGNTVLNKKFSYTKENGESSGKLMSHPTYSSVVNMNDGYMGGFENMACIIENNATFLVRTSNTNIPLGLNQGAHVGYDRVIEHFLTSTQQPQDNGYKIYQYKNLPDQSNGANAPTTTFSYKNGLLLNEKTYSANNTLLEEVINQYDTSGYGLIGKGFRIYEISNNGCYFCMNRKFEYLTYGTPTEKVELRTVTTKSYDLPLAPIENISKFYYTPYDQIDSLVQFVKGSADPKITLYDYHTVDHTALREKYSYFMKSGGLKLFTEAVKYDLNSSIKPDKVYIMNETNSPAISPDYSLRLEYTAYNAVGKPISYKLIDNIETTIIWDLNSEYPIAEITNATPTKTFFNSFEQNGLGQTGTLESPNNPAHAGRKYLNSGAYNFSNAGFVPSDTIKLKMSYWYWSNSKWNFRGIIPFSNTFTQGTRLDDIRVFPANSFMTTYTYEPGKGITSVTDANSVISYYVYDTLNRLKFIKDENGNILKSFEYHYKE